MPLPTNAIIAAMLGNNLTDIDSLFKNTSSTLEALTPDTKNRLKDMGYDVDESLSEPDILISFAYRWHENAYGSKQRAKVLTHILDALYPISPSLYFTHLLQIAKLTALNMIQLNQAAKHPYHQAIRLTSPGLTTLAQDLNDRIKNKKHPRKDLLALTTQRDSQSNPLQLTDLPETTAEITRLTSDELSAITVLIQANTPENREKALSKLLPSLCLDEPESTLFSSILQRIIFSEHDLIRPLGTTNLEIAYAMVNSTVYGKPRFYPVISEDLLCVNFHGINQTEKSPQDLIQNNPLLHDVHSKAIKNDEGNVDELKACLETRFDISKRYFKHNADDFSKHKMALYKHYSHGKHISTTTEARRRKSSDHTLVYPNWAIETMLESFKIDINLPLNEGDAPIVEWFKSKSPSVFKHLLSINGVIPCNENIDIISEFIAQQLKDHPTKKGRLTDKAKALLAKIDDCDAKEAFKAQMQDIGLFKKPVVDIPAIALPLQATAPTSAPRANVTELILNAIMEKKYNDQLFDTLSQTQPTEIALTELKDKLKSSTTNKDDLLGFKRAINQYIASHDQVKQALESILENHSADLNTAAEKNVLLYLLALGRSKFQLNTKRGYFGKQNHFTALCDYIQEKSPEGSRYQTFGLFKPNNAVSPLSEPEMKAQGGNLLS